MTAPPRLPPTSLLRGGALTVVRGAPVGATAVLVPVLDASDLAALRTTLTGFATDLSAASADAAAPCTVLVIDDATTPGVALSAADVATPTLVLRLPFQHGWERATNAGLALARAMGFAIVQHLEPGDYLRPGRLAAAVAALEARSATSLVAAPWTLVNAARRTRHGGRPARTPAAIRRALRLRDALPLQAVVYRLRLVTECGGLSTDYPEASTLEFLTRLVRMARIAVLEEPHVVIADRRSLAAVRRALVQRWSVVRLRARVVELRAPSSWLGLLGALALAIRPAIRPGREAPPDDAATPAASDWGTDA